MFAYWAPPPGSMKRDLRNGLHFDARDDSSWVPLTQARDSVGHVVGRKGAAETVAAPPLLQRVSDVREIQFRVGAQKLAQLLRDGLECSWGLG